jgi:hypothetical protein
MRGPNVAVDRPVTVDAERNQILFAVVAKVAPRLEQTGG